jgi:NAD(P) transhydrogenase subunit alpha
MYARTIQNLLGLMIKDGQLNLNMEDEIIKGMCITRDGEIVHEQTRKAMNIDPVEAPVAAADPQPAPETEAAPAPEPATEPEPAADPEPVAQSRADVGGGEDDTSTAESEADTQRDREM